MRHPTHRVLAQWGCCSPGHSTSRGRAARARRGSATLRASQRRSRLRLPRIRCSITTTCMDRGGDTGPPIGTGRRASCRNNGSSSTQSRHAELRSTGLDAGSPSPRRTLHRDSGQPRCYASGSQCTPIPRLRGGQYDRRVPDTASGICPRRRCEAICARGSALVSSSRGHHGSARPRPSGVDGRCPPGASYLRG